MGGSVKVKFVVAKEARHVVQAPSQFTMAHEEDLLADAAATRGYTWVREALGTAKALEYPGAGPHAGADLRRRRL
jgi:hypothetical protein